MATGEGGYPLSFAQEQLWFLDQLRSGAATEQLLHRAYRLHGDVDAAALSTALRRVAERHEVLRTRYRATGGGAEQVIDDEPDIELSTVDLTGAPAAERESLAREAVAAELRSPVDLRARHPWRASLVRLSEAESVLLVVVHHIAFDGWSWRVLLGELTAFYGELTLGAPAELEEPFQYADYAEWERERWAADPGLLERQVGYWREALAGLAPLELPTDRPRRARWEAAGDSLDFEVPAELAAGVAALGRRGGASPFMAHLAAFQLLLGRYAGSPDVAVGVSVTGRAQAELEGSIGLFLNTVVLRADLSGDPTFADLLARVRDTTLDAYGHQEAPFERVVAALAPERDLSRNPVFQVGFALHGVQREPFTLPGLVVEKFPTPWAGSAFDLSLHLVERPDGSMLGQLLYPTALFDRDTVERMAANHLRLLSRVVAEPDTPVGALELVAEPELRRLREWNRTDAPAPSALLPELFAAQAKSTPDAVAVLSDSDSLTYAELAARVDRLADYLRGRGVGLETPVGVCLRRGPDLVVALLAVLAAGGVHVPLPPDHPADRLAFMAADAGVALVLTEGALLERLPAGPPLVALDRQRAEVEAAAPADRPELRGGNAAYVMYTSGSTGAPKGVVVPHEGIRNRVLWSVDRYGLTAADRVLQKTTTGFDASMWEFLSPLVSGGAVAMAPESAHKDPAVMARAVAAHGVTVLQVVPSVLRLLVEDDLLAGCDTLRLVCSAGEPLPSALCDRLLKSVDVEVFNTYGPTECSIDSTAHHYTPGEAGEIVPIGAPLPNMRAHVVDGDGRLAPIGVPGELWVGGVGLARGYLGRGDLTAERFTPDPFSPEPGGRLYRTGDLARWRADGTLEFIGRVDHQVKVRGVRVEPGEVEAVLCAHPSVSAAVVTTHRPASGDLELVAHVVPAEGARIDQEALRGHLADRLPAAMVPSAVVALDALPLTPNGKVDRKALPAPEAARPVAAATSTAPRTPTERAVAEVMAEVLGVDSLGVDDDFFAMGGHSLLAIRLVLRLRRAFDLEIGVGELFEAPTVARLAALVDGGAAAGADAGAAIRPVPRDGALPLSFGQQRMWFLDQLEPGSAEYLVPLALRLRGPLALPALRVAVDEVARRHEVLRTRYVADGGDPAQVVDPPGPVPFEVTDLGGRADAEERAFELVDRACGRPFDLAAEWPLRVDVARVADDDHLVALTLHHIAFDAWSMGIFLRDLDTAYHAAAGGAPARLEPPAVQYADFAAWQRDRQDGPDLAAQFDYWRGRLAGLTPVELPADRPRAVPRDPRGDTLVVEVPDELAGALAEVGSARGATLFMTLLAAFQVLLGRYTGRDDVAVGTPVAGRTRQETEELLGFLVNNVVLRADLSGDPAFTDFLDQVREGSLAAFAHQDLPFEHLVDALSPERDLSRNPLFQVMFELQHMDRVPATLAGAAMEPLHAGTPVAKFDLTLTVKQRADGRLRCWFEYATALFDRTTVERMAGHYLRLLESVAADPGARLGGLELLTDAERADVQGDWADPGAARLALLDPPAERGVVVAELIERQAARTPDALAVVGGDRELTYAELNARANRLAHRLRELGIGPETAVGSCMERSADAVVALLAVLKAGGVYVPFDPGHPAERLGFMLADADVRLVLTSRRFADALSATGHPVELVDAELPHPDTNPPTTVDPDNLAYVIYTSGSTGRPKGVMIGHRAYAHHCRVIADAYGIAPGERVVLLSALTFDVSMDQIAATLAAGATVVVADPLFWAPGELAERLAEHRVTIMEITPAYYRALMDSGVDTLTGLKLINLSSDVVTVADAQRWAATGLPGRFLCCYGPTEATVTCTLHPVDGDLAGERPEAAMPIGRSAPGTRTYVLDADLRPVPAGVPGELYLGGDRLARGYHDRPATTAERFVPDPFSAEPGGRLYRTGDLVRRRPDGVIDFLGRVDRQVKLRGFRIELGEVEAALLRHPAVREAAAVVREVAPGDPRLVAYLEFRPGPAPDVAELRAFLRDLLPEYMVPGLWVPMAALPLTTSGKVDRKALPAPDMGAAGAASGREHVPPRDPVEEVVVAAWAEVLGVERVGVTDNFFALGGHSLLATRVLARLRDAFAVDIPLRLLFEAATAAELAAAVADAVAADIAALSDDEVAELLAGEGVR